MIKLLLYELIFVSSRKIWKTIFVLSLCSQIWFIRLVVTNINQILKKLEQNYRTGIKTSFFHKKKIYSLDNTFTGILWNIMVRDHNKKRCWTKILKSNLKNMSLIITLINKLCSPSNLLGKRLLVCLEGWTCIIDAIKKK